jgi:hypothetical protein
VEHENTENSQENSQTVGEVISPPRNRAAHLGPHRFKPGKSGNPGGRPKSGPLTDSLFKIAMKKAPHKSVSADIEYVLGKRPKMHDLLMYRLWGEAMRGNVQAIKEILNRMEGRNPHTIAVADTSKLGELQAALMAGPMEPGQTNEVPEEDEEDDDDEG